MSSYEKLQNIFKEDEKKLSSSGRKRLDAILGKKESVVKWQSFKDIFQKLKSPFLKLDSLIFKDPPKYTNQFNKR